MAVIASVLLGTVQMAGAQSPIVALTEPRQPDTLQGHIDSLLDPSRRMSLSDILGLPKGSFVPVTTAFPDFGYTESHIWLRLSVKNQTSDIKSWRIHFRENFKQFMAVHIVRPDGSIETIYDVGLTDGFSKRPIEYPEMVAPFMLNPNEEAEFYINYWSEGASELAFGFETENSFASVAGARTAKNFLYYGMTILPVLLAVLGFAIYRHGVFLAYVASWLSALAYLMHADGVTFQYLWPNNPAFNSYASIPIGAALIILAPNFARVFLNTKTYHPYVNKVLWAIMLCAMAMVVASFFADRQVIKKVLVLLSLISVSLCAISGVVAAFSRFKEVRFFVIAWIGFLGTATIMNLRHWLGIEISQDFQNDAIRTVMVVDATLMGLSIADRYNQLRQSRQLAIEERYKEETRNLRLLARLSDLEKRYAQETERLRERDFASADTLHDLQQPIAALRLNIRALMDQRKEGAADVEGVENSFVYIERLMNAAVREREKEFATLGIQGTEHTQTATSFGLRKVTDNVMQMFLPDAAEKGLELRYFPSEHDFEVQPLAAMRMLSNLLSNAIKYTDTGKILFCVRKQGETLRVEIHDTGPGLSAGAFERARSRNTRLFQTAEGKDGEGLGLSIVSEIAEQTGYQLHRLCDRKHGLSIGVTFTPN
ncbi:MAG: sensor histidine kinase [Sulfitobacter sp.]